VAANLDFNMAAITNRAQNDVFYHNFGSTTDTNIIQVDIPRFLGPANQMVPSAITSHGRHIGFQDGQHEVHPKTFFCDNFGSIKDTNIMQVAIPRFSGPANQMVPSAMTSHGGHIGFQYGRHEVHPKTFFCHNFGSITDTNIIQVAIPRFLGPANQMVPSAMTSHGRHVGFQDGPMRSTPKRVFAITLVLLNIMQVAMPQIFGSGQSNGAIGDDVTWTPYWISRWLP
jgi:predicted alpha/beta-fold hydrolase